MKASKPGGKCPNCGAEGKYHGEHETAVRNYKLCGRSIVDVGWRCWNCGWEWGFEVQEGMITLDEWAEKSRKGEVCGILGCQNKPVKKCPHCRNHYCQEHAFVLDTPGHLNPTTAARITGSFS